jgi:hypothetical protein
MRDIKLQAKKGNLFVIFENEVNNNQETREVSTAAINIQRVYLM